MRWIVAAAGLLATGLVVGSLTMASSAPANQTIKGTESGKAYDNHRKYIDVDDNGSAYGRGDLITSRATLKQNDDGVGKVFDTCQIVDTRGPGLAQCTSTLDYFGGGTITFAGTQHEDPSPGVAWTLGITGGTGQFTGATGTVKISFGTHNVHYTFNVGS
jgi:hypothetical protein